MLEALSCVLSRWLIVARSLVSSSTVVHVGWTVICSYMSHGASAVHTTLEYYVMCSRTRTMWRVVSGLHCQYEYSACLFILLKIGI